MLADGLSEYQDGLEDLHGYVVETISIVEGKTGLPNLFELRGRINDAKEHIEMGANNIAMAALFLGFSPDDIGEPKEYSIYPAGGESLHTED